MSTVTTQPVWAGMRLESGISYTSFLAFFRRLLQFDSLHKLFSHKVGQSQESVIRAYAIRPTRRVSSMAIDKFPLSINFDTAKYILRVGYTSEIWYASLIKDVYPSSSSTAAISALITRTE